VSQTPSEPEEPSRNKLGPRGRAAAHVFTRLTD
jgi:hypothetical protein